MSTANIIGNAIFGLRNKSGGNYIDPVVKESLVGLWIADQNTNESPTRNIIKNTIKDKGGDLELQNFGYKLNSGYGKYEEDFTDWRKINPIDSISSDSFYAVNIAPNLRTMLVRNHNTGDEMPQWKVMVSGLKGEIIYILRTESGNIRHQILSEGINILEKSYAYAGDDVVGFAFYPGASATITQIPSFEGALVTDGKDDLITSTKTVKEMLRGSNEVTVVSMVHQIGLSSLTTINNIRSESVAHVVCRNICSSAGKTGVYGYSRQINTNNPPTLINNILGDKKDYTAEGNSALDPTDKFFVQGYKYSGTISEVSPIAYYWTFIANKVLTTDQINQVISYFNLDKHVKPDIIYDTIRQGITNENHASFNDELVDFSGNGHNMKIYNSAWNKESGINDEGAWQTDGVSDYGNVENLPILKDYTVAIERRWITSPVDKNQCLAFKGHTNDWGAFACEFSNAGQLRSYTFSPNYNILQSYNEKSLVYQSKYSYSGTPIDAEATIDGSTLRLCLPRGGFPFYANVAIKMFLLFPYSLSEFLIERQLKRYKLGTLYPGMIEWRPIAKSNIPYKQIDYFIKRSGAYVRLNPGDYFQSTEDIIVRVTPIRDWQLDVVSSIKVNGKNEVISVNSSYAQTAPIHIDKSPQKINITIDEYIRYEDIVQPYPAIINLNQDGKTITWGDKLKVGSDIVFVESANLLPELYTVSDTRYNGVTLYPNTIIKVEKSMVFDNARTYLKANEPNCILSPNRLRIPNSSYKILGYIPDLTGKGNHGKLNNFAYAGMSGANGYVEDFTKWSKNLSLDDVEITYDRIKVNKLTGSTVLYVTSNKFINKIKIVASGIPNGGKLTFTQYPDNAIENNKEFEIGGVTTTGSWGFSIKEGLNLDWSNLVIQQIGEHEGSICFDGTDDYIIIPTIKHGGKALLMKVNWRYKNNIAMAYDQRINWVGLGISISRDQLPFVAYKPYNKVTYIDGIRNESVLVQDLEGITHNITGIYDNLNLSDERDVCISRTSDVSNSGFADMSMYEFMLFPDVPNEEEIKELNDIVGIEENLFLIHLKNDDTEIINETLILNE